MQDTMYKKLIFISMLFLYGCATPMQQTERDIGSHQPQEYKEGYTDGCGSGQKAGGYIYAKFNKDVIRYSTDQLYKQGWDDGFNICKSRFESNKRDWYGR